MIRTVWDRSLHIFRFRMGTADKYNLMWNDFENNFCKSIKTLRNNNRYEIRIIIENMKIESTSQRS